MIKYEPESLLTDDPVIAVTIMTALKRYDRDGLHPRCDRYHTYIFSWAEVDVAIQPVEGEGYICDNVGFINRPLAVFSDYQRNGEDSYYHKRALNIVTTRAELRELVEYARPKVGG